jgi:glycosyltransferase involved in cell wall biosynthesis
MKSVDVFVSNSLYEGYGMSVVEAGFCKCPIVTTKTGIAKSIFKDLENCLFVSCLDISGISDKINMFLDDKLFSEKIINNTFNLLNDNYSFENYVEDYISLLKKCLS